MLLLRVLFCFAYLMCPYYKIVHWMWVNTCHPVEVINLSGKTLAPPLISLQRWHWFTALHCRREWCHCCRSFREKEATASFRIAVLTQFICLHFLDYQRCRKMHCLKDKWQMTEFQITVCAVAAELLLRWPAKSIEFYGKMEISTPVYWTQN